MKALFPLGSLVYRRCEPEDCGTVTGHLHRPHNVLHYVVSWGGDSGESAHYELELTSERLFDGVPPKEEETS